MKKICYSLIVLSYFLLGFLLVYYTKINPDYEGNLGLILSIVIVAIWLVTLILMLTNKSNHISNNKDIIEDWLGTIVFAPFILIIIIPAILFILIISIIDIFNNRIKNKCKVVLEKGFVLTKEKHDKRNVYLLSKENFIIKIREFDIYEISLDYGETYTNISKSPFISYDDKIEIENILYRYYSCDYRDKDLYDPTRGIIQILSKYFS